MTCSATHSSLALPEPSAIVPTGFQLAACLKRFVLYVRQRYESGIPKGSSAYARWLWQWVTWIPSRPVQLSRAFFRSIVRRQTVGRESHFPGLLLLEKPPEWFGGKRRRRHWR